MLSYLCAAKEEEAVVQLPGGKLASPAPSGGSVPSFRAMAAANLTSAAPTKTAAAPASPNNSASAKMNGKVQFGAGSSASTAGAAASVPNLPPRTHSAPPAMDDSDGDVVVPVVVKSHAAPPAAPVSLTHAEGQHQPMGPPSQGGFHGGHPMHPHPHYPPMHYGQGQQGYRPVMRPPYYGPGAMYAGAVAPPPPPHYVGGPMMMRPPMHGGVPPPPPAGTPGYISYRPAGPGVTSGDVPVISQLPPPQRKKIAIVNPETGEDVTKDIVPTVKPSLSSLASPTTLQKEAPISPAVPARVAVIVNPLDNKPVDLSALAAASKPSTDAAADEDVFGIDDASIFSGGELDDLEDGLGEGSEDESEQEDEEEYTGPRLLRPGQKVDYPRTMVQFTPPTSSDGVWAYDRAFLLQFRPICTWKPEMELEKVQRARVAQQSQRREYRTERRGERRGRAPTSTSGIPAVLTNRAANAWARLGEAVLPEEEKLLREVKGMLNKLTLDKFDVISDKIIGLGIMRKSIMPGTIDLIFDKAVEEPKFASMYARLVLKIVLHETEEKQKAVVAEGEKVESEFRRFLISKCQVEYEKKKAWSVSRLAKLQSESTEESAELSPEEQARRAEAAAKKAAGELTEEDYELIKTKRRVLGNMRFIGELFNVGLITERIMHAVIVELLRDVVNPEEEEIESLCRLVTTVGPKLDTPAAAKHVESYLARMHQLTANTILSTRVRFMVLDVLDLRKARWAGKDREMPKTLADFERELKEKQAAAAARKPSGSRDRGERERPGSARPPSTLHQQHSSTSVSSREEHNTSRRADRPSAFAGRNERRPDERRGSGFTTVSSSRGSPAMRTATPVERPPSAASSVASAVNRYDLLMGGGEDNAPQQSTPAIVINWEGKEALSRVLSALKEFIQYKKPAEFMAVWSESVPVPHQAEALGHLLSQALDSGEKLVDALCQLLGGELGQQLSQPAVRQAFMETLSTLDELTTDAPRAPEYAGKLIAASIDALVMPPEAPLVLLRDVVQRSPRPAVLALLNTVLAVRPDTPSAQQMTNVAGEALLKYIEYSGPAAIKARQLHRLAPKLQSAALAAHLAGLPQPYETFLQAARPFLLDQLDLAQHQDKRLVLRALSTAAFSRLHGEKASAKALESEKLPTMLACLSIFAPEDTAPVLLEVITTDFNQDAEWPQLAVKATLAAGLVQPEELKAWREGLAPETLSSLSWLSSL